MIKSEIFELIQKEVIDKKLLNLINNQFLKDNWGESLVGLKNLINNNSLNFYDKKVALIFLCRDYSLTYRYGECHDIIIECDSIISKLNDDNQSHHALKGFIFHQFAISLGYMGKKRDPRYKEYLNHAYKIYDN